MIRRDFKKEPDYLIEVFGRTIKSFFPKIGKWVKYINEPRYKNMLTYQLPILFWEAVFLFIFKLQSTRNINYQMVEKEKFFENFKKLFPILGITQHTLQRLPDQGTLKYLLKKLSYDELEKITLKMGKRLIRKRVLESSRLLDKYYLIAIDGTRFLSFKERHCPHCLKKKIATDESGNPIYEYYHYVLAVDLVTPSKFSMPLLAEFVENESEGVRVQDCELKAFYRIAKRIKKHFPRTKLCLLFDSLYAGKPTFDLCKKFNWQYIIRFKKGSMPAFHKEYKEYLPFFPENRAKCELDHKISQNFQWVNDIDYCGHKLHVLECFEKKVGLNKKKNFTWISSIRVNHNNYDKLSNKGGRCRWKIENQGFNTQKNGGYNLEHAYSEECNAIKCFYFFLQIAHFINQLIEKGGLIRNFVKKVGSVKNFAVEFWMAFVTETIDEFIIEEIIKESFQIRLDSS